MDGSNESYYVNFFKPSTPFLKENIKAIVIGLVIWGVAVYGFHIMLKLIEKPTPEASYLVYQDVYPKLTQGTATLEEKRNLANIYLTLAAKAVPLRKNVALKNTFTATLYDILPDNQKQSLISVAAQLDTNKKVNLDFVNEALGIGNNATMKAVVPYTLASLDGGVKGLVNTEIPAIMDRYLIHNQSVLTENQFLCFPFHYFYSAIFLLVLFVVICLVYCQVIDGIMKKYEMETADE